MYEVGSDSLNQVIVRINRLGLTAIEGRNKALLNHCSGVCVKNSSFSLFFAILQVFIFFPSMSFLSFAKVQPSIITRWLTGKHNFTVETLFEIERQLDIKLFAIDMPVSQVVSYHMVVDSGASSLSPNFHLSSIADLTPNAHYYGGSFSAKEHFENLYYKVFDSPNILDGE